MKIIDLDKSKTGYVVQETLTQYLVEWHNCIKLWVQKSEVNGINLEVIK